jgi:hypothetical protein
MFQLIIYGRLTINYNATLLSVFLIWKLMIILFDNFENTLDKLLTANHLVCCDMLPLLLLKVYLTATVKSVDYIQTKNRRQSKSDPVKKIVADPLIPNK